MSFGADATGVNPSNLAMQSAISSLNGNAGVINLPAGTFLFTSSIILPDSVILRGAGSTSTLLQFNLNGTGDLIRIAGSAQLKNSRLISSSIKDSSFVEITNPSNFSIGDYFRIYQNDSSIVTSSWAYNSVGQIMHITSIVGNRVYFNGVLRKNYLLSDSCKFEKCNMKKSIGIECMKIERLDASVGQTTNIAFDYAADCWVSGIESYNCNFGHLVFSKCTNCYVYGNYFHHAFAYGGNGQGYGVVLQYTSGECLVENNVFNHLRHSMLLQAGANGNVCAFNYSLDTYWTSFPSNSAGDIVLHGNYIFMNLFEENIVQNIVIDASHGINGPYNTFFRNRAELYGIVMSTNPSSDNQNYIGNEITNSSFPYGQYSLTGIGNFEFGNNKQGTCIPSNTSAITDISYYYTGTPWFLTSNYSYPTIGYSNSLNANSIPAKDRYSSGNFTLCSNILTEATNTKQNKSIALFPNPANDVLFVQSDYGSALTFSIYNSEGKLVDSGDLLHESKIDLTALTNGIYFITFSKSTQAVSSQKFILNR